MHDIDDLVLDEINEYELASVLSQIANFYSNQGFRVKRGRGGVVIVMLEYGEFHYIPCIRGIGFMSYTYMEALI